MQSAEYDRMYQLEQDYWWFGGRHDLILTLLADRCAPSGNLTLLDLGCGTGAMSIKLASWGEVISADASERALSYSGKRGLTRLCLSDATSLPFDDNAFDAVVALDILEHVSEDRQAIQEVFRVLKPGGRFLISVPAYKFLWSGHDVALMHHRRYTAGEVRMKFEQAGFQIERLTYAMTILFPIVWLFRMIERRRKSPGPQAHLVEVSPWVNSLLAALLRFENKVIRRLNLPFGVSVVGVAQKPEHAE